MLATWAQVCLNSPALCLPRLCEPAAEVCRKGQSARALSWAPSSSASVVLVETQGVQVPAQASEMYLYIVKHHLFFTRRCPRKNESPSTHQPLSSSTSKYTPEATKVLTHAPSDRWNICPGMNIYGSKQVFEHCLQPFGIKLALRVTLSNLIFFCCFLQPRIHYTPYYIFCKIMQTYFYSETQGCSYSARWDMKIPGRWY